MKPQERAKELAAAHWDYTGGLLKVAQYDAEVMALAEFLYKAAAVHFYGHAVEDCQNGMFSIFGDDVDEVALEAELDRSSGNAAADAEHSTRTKDLFTRGCPTCLDSAACAKAMTTDTGGKCLFHRPSLRENMLDAKQKAAIASKVDCADCDSATCSNASFPMHMERCGGYKAKQEAPTAAVLPLDFTLPSITLKCTAEEARGKYYSEMEEWRAAKSGSLHEMVEKWDCLQALYTAYQRGADVAWYQDNVRSVMDYLTHYAAEGKDVMEARRGMLLKNAKRSYYSPEINAAIIASKGHRFQPLDEMGVI